MKIKRTKNTCATLIIMWYRVIKFVRKLFNTKNRHAIYGINLLCAGEKLLHGVGAPANPSKHPPSVELEAVEKLHLHPPTDHPVAVAVQA